MSKHYYAHIFYWTGEQDVIEVTTVEANDLLIAVERQAFVRIGNTTIDGSTMRKVDILTTD